MGIGRLFVISFLIIIVAAAVLIWTGCRSRKDRSGDLDYLASLLPEKPQGAGRPVSDRMRFF